MFQNDTSLKPREVHRHLGATRQFARIAHVGRSVPFLWRTTEIRRLHGGEGGIRTLGTGSPLFR